MSNNGGNLTVQYNLRWSEELRDKIAEAAKENTRSMNQEVISRLESSFTSTRVASDPYKRMLLAVIAAIVAEEADKEKPSFREAIDKITKAILIDEEWFNKTNGLLKESK